MIFYKDFFAGYQIDEAVNIANEWIDATGVTVLNVETLTDGAVVPRDLGVRIWYSKSADVEK